MEILRTINKVLAWPLVVLLWVYQHTLSPDHGPLKSYYPYGACKFYPTCSVYARALLQKEGITALPKIFNRVSSCTPSSLGGIDLPYADYKAEH